MSDPSAGDRPSGGAARQIIKAEAGASVYAVLQGDLHIRNGYPVYQIVPVPSEHPGVSGPQAAMRPSVLLAAENAVVGFRGREDVTALLRSWRDAPEAGVTALLVHGPGGQGKTRLAAHFTQGSSGEGWRVCEAHHLSDPTAYQVVQPGELGDALLLVVDYADRWPLDDLLLLLLNPLLRVPGRRTRVLLLARAAQSWWPALRHRLTKAGYLDVRTVPLSSLAPTLPERQRVFDEAGAAFSAALALPQPDTATPPELTGPGYETVLTLHMAALVAVEARARGEEPPLDPAGLSSYLLDREHDFWQNAHDHGGVSVSPAVMGRIVYTATLTQGLGRAEAVAALEQSGALPDAQADAALDDHASCYPVPAGQVDQTWLHPLRPDRLGEDFLALTTPGHSHPAYVPDSWADGAAARLLHAPKGVPGYARPAVVTLIDTARRWPHMGRTTLFPLLARDPGLALAAGGAALAGLAELQDTDLDVLQAVNDLLPHQLNVDLDTGIAVLVKRLTEHELATDTDDRTRGRLHQYLAERLTNAGRREEALRETEAAVALRRTVAQREPSLNRELARSLTALGRCLAECGRRDEAVEAAQESIGLLGRESGALSPADKAFLAAAYGGLAMWLAESGQVRQAVTAAEEGVARLRELGLSSEGPMAEMLGLLGARLSAVGSPRAVEVTLESIELLRPHAAAQPQLYEPQLASGLSNVGYMLQGQGRHEESLDALREAIERARRLGKANPDRWDALLSQALCNLSAVLWALGRSAEGLDAAQESVLIRRRLSVTNDAVFSPLLAQSLNNYAITLHLQGERVAALETSAESLAIRERFAAAHPQAYEIDLAKSLDTFAEIRAECRHDLPSALEAARRAVEIFTRWHARMPAAFASALRSVESTLALVTDAVGSPDDTAGAQG
ncbi:tetratricopeptide repeat protein [Streptomyces sp. NPDC002855]|uniref:tetratricopeptide repeat protein n=1 Tax=Streptomyces sp. NPDC002855 TaxID=3154437 RepID=UPI003326BC56